jgi:hypothetical protein
MADNRLVQEKRANSLPVLLAASPSSVSSVDLRELIPRIGLAGEQVIAVVAVATAVLRVDRFDGALGRITLEVVFGEFSRADVAELGASI